MSPIGDPPGALHGRRDRPAPRALRTLSLVVERDQRRDRRRDLRQDRRRVVREHRADARLDARAAGPRGPRAPRPSRRRVARRPLLVGVPRGRIEPAPVGEERVHRAQHLGRLVEPAQELVDVDAARRLESLPAAVHEDEARAPRAEDGRVRPRPSRRTRARRARPVPAAQRAGSLRDRDGVRRARRSRGRTVGRRVGQAVAAEVHDNGADRATQPARDGAQAQAGWQMPWIRRTPGRSGGPPQSRKWTRTSVVGRDHEALGFGGRMGRPRPGGRPRSERTLGRHRG